jgi:uroporphyrinogen decarboxylase
MQRILEVNATAVATYLNAQIDAGAQGVMVFDSWGGVLADGAFQRFSLHYTHQVLRQLKRDADGRRVPCIVFTKGGGPWLDQMADIGADVLGVDWTVNLGAARARVGNRVALQGNLDPAVLFADAAAIQAQARGVLDSFGDPQRADGSWDGHVFNLGHGISQHTPPDSVAALIEAVHSHSRRQRRTT